LEKEAIVRAEAYAAEFEAEMLKTKQLMVAQEQRAKAEWAERTMVSGIDSDNQHCHYWGGLVHSYTSCLKDNC